MLRRQGQHVVCPALRRLASHTQQHCTNPRHLFTTFYANYATTSNTLTPSKDLSRLQQAIGQGNIQQAAQAYKSMMSTSKAGEQSINRELIRKLLMLARHGKRREDIDFINRVISDMKQRLQMARTPFEYHALMYAFGIQQLPEKAYDILERMKREDNIRPTLHSYNTLLGCYKRVNNVDRAEEILAEMKQRNIKPDTVTYNTMLHLLLRTHQYQRVLDMYSAMKADKTQPDIYTFSTLLDAAVKSKDLHFGSEIYSQITRKCKPKEVDLTMVNNMIRFMADSSGLNKTLDLYYDLPDRYPHIRPDKVTFNILLDVCFKNQNPAKAYQIFGDMTAAKLEPDVVTYGTLIDAEAKMGHLKASIQLFQDMCNASIEPNDRIFNSLANIASSKSARPSDLNDLMDLVDQYQHKLKLDTKAYNALMYGLAQNGRSSQAQHLYDTVFRHATCKPDIATFTHLILAYINDNQLDGALEIYYTLREHHKKCKQDAATTKHKVKIPIQLDTTFYSTIIAALSKDDFNHTISFSDDANESSPRLLAAISIFNDMRPLQIQPTMHTYTAMLHACGQYRDQYALDQVHKLIKVDLYLDPDIAIYNAMMDAYNRTGNGEKVLDIWQTLSTAASDYAQVAPDQTTVSIVFDSCGHNGYIQQAQSIWTFLKRTQFKLNTNNYNSYIECLCRSRGRQGWDAAMAIVEQDMSVPGKPQHGKPVLDEKTLNTLLSFARKKAFDASELDQLDQWRTKMLSEAK
ncbi:uncharacterized protein ATC70_013303 [Mucor velutinosus]|uniref:Pentacotripeptide-repeat region of PRORP domain-containing protein n=1 Tax=Mucor velutinosus TaxID=708070 RepID=A0AAN7HRJ7_9FUNG|nr:hypothetical protein ATC70_013303 [Mucor velutinosus]